MNIRARGTDRLLDVLDFVAKGEPGTRNAIAAALKAPRSTVYTIVDTLLERGYVEQMEPDGLIMPGRGCALLGLAYDQSARLAQQARQIINALAAASGEVAELDVLQGWRQLILISGSGRGHGYRSATEGAHFPLPCTAAARFLLDGVDFGDLKAAIPRHDFVTPTGVVITPRSLYEDVALAREQGHWITRALVDPYVACVTAPVRTRSGRCIGVVCLVVPLQEIDRREQDFVSMTVEAAAKLSSHCALLRNPAF